MVLKPGTQVTKFPSKTCAQSATQLSDSVVVVSDSVTITQSCGTLADGNFVTWVPGTNRKEHLSTVPIKRNCVEQFSTLLLLFVAIHKTDND